MCCALTGLGEYRKNVPVSVSGHPTSERGGHSSEGKNQAEGDLTLLPETDIRWNSRYPAERISKNRSRLRIFRARRLGIVRGFARWLSATDARTQIPPHGLLPSGQRRPTPYIYSDQEVADLMAAAHGLPSATKLRCWTFATQIRAVRRGAPRLRRNPVKILRFCTLAEGTPEAVLRLRSLRSSGDFEEYWEFRLRREWERNHRSLYTKGLQCKAA